MASGGSARVSENFVAAKERFIDQMVAEFEQNLQIFSSDVKTTMRAVPAETAMRVFEVALVFLTQAFPNLTDCRECSDENQTGTRTFEDRLIALESKIEDQARTTEDELKLYGDRLEASQKKLEKSQDQLQARITKHGKNLRKLNESSNSCSESVLSFKKLQTLVNKMVTIPKTTTATAQASVPPPTSSSSPSQTPKTTTTTAKASVPPPTSSSSSSSQTPKTTTATAQTSVPPTTSSSSPSQTPQTTTATAQASVPPPTSSSSPSQTPKTTTATAKASFPPPTSSSSSSQTPKTTTATAKASVPPPTSSSSSSSSKTPKTTTATAKASVPPPSSSSSSSSQASAAASPRGPPKSLRQKHTFSAQISGDRKTPNIQDVKLLPGGLVLLSDSENKCVKLFNTQGQHLHSQSLDGCPSRLAVMDITSVSGWDVAVSMYVKNKVSILGVSNTRLSVKTSLFTSGLCYAVAAVNAQTLAVGYWGYFGIDLINLTGQVLRHLTSDVDPYFMATTLDLCLVVSTTSKTLVKLQLVDGTKVFVHKGQQIRQPAGITCDQDGTTIVVASGSSNSLHLVSPEGRYVRNLLKCPGGSLRSVSTCQNVCVSCSNKGTVVVCDIVF